ncbi:ATP-binding protein [Nitrosopumilus sp.]|uniref:sensor histidine kinase n=1 Tax=Nitrosopumilus sp. TaxID=2024843 RepID=UPI002638911B|nr:ATP-binding protein [Nitrosopumilus sp.]
MQTSKELEAVGELSTRIAHDLKTPLSVLRNSVEILKAESDSETKTNIKLLDSMSRAINRIDHQLNEVLEFVMPKNLDLKTHSLFEMLEGALVDILNLEHVTVCLPYYDVKILCDRKKMEIVFENILLNAVQAMQNNGKIQIEWDETDTEVHINMKDSGHGIPEKLLQRIFDPLFTTRQVGTGLGLPVCKTIVEQHNGSIRAETEFGKSTTFCISLKKQQDL